MKRFIANVVLTALAAQVMPCTAQPGPPFSCGPEAYLFQGDTTGMWALDLATGQAALLKAHFIPSGPNQILNAFGYNPKDNYIWGVRKNTNELIRIASDFSDSLFFIPFMPAASLNVGDFDANGVMYLYDSGTSTIYRIDLDPGSPGYLQQLPPVPTQPAIIYDWAFSPVDGFLYGVDTMEQVIRFDPANGTQTLLGTASGGGIGSATGSFGAAYMDVAGNMYIAENDSGWIYRIDTIHTGNTTASFFATGPSASVNDGARCPTASVPTGIKEEMPGLIIAVYPNPFHDLISLSLSTDEMGEVMLFDVAGRLLHRERFHRALEIPLRHLSRGAYLLQITAGASSTWKKILKQ